VPRGAAPDPASVLLENAARRLLDRAYARPGQWVRTILADPAPRAAQWLASQGIDPRGADDAATAGGARRGGLDARDRWSRAMVRAVYRQHRWWSPGPGERRWRTERRTVKRLAGAVRFRAGRRYPAVGVIPAGREIELRYDPDTRAARRAVARMPASAQMYDNQGRPGGRHGDRAARDWEREE
jgi:hypothetical protein